MIMYIVVLSDDEELAPAGAPGVTVIASGVVVIERPNDWPGTLNCPICSCRALEQTGVDDW